MAREQLDLVIKADNRASKEIDKLNSSIKKLKPTFKKMALIGSVSFTGLSLGIGIAVKQAGIAEGSMNKFLAVFQDGSGDMLKFIDIIRKEMPLAKSEIIRMAADLQDLLIPMGLSREKGQEMTKSFLDLANKIAAFNDVNPTEVLESIRAGIVGSSEPLRKFGVDARVTALETVALEEGLIKAGQSFAKLDPVVRSQVQAQALLIQITKQSSDAINGFEQNQDSFIRRSQEMQASITETKEAIGNVLLPILDDLLKKILPVIKNITEWIENNPELTKTIIIISTALAGLVAVAGLLGLALPLIITGFTLLFSPIGLIILAVGTLILAGVLLVKNWGVVKKVAGTAWLAIGNTISDIITRLKDMFKDFINFVISGLNSIIKLSNKINRTVSKVPGINIKQISEIPQLANGGIVTRPTLAMIGEAGAEAVIPLNKKGSGMGATIINNFNGNFTSEEMAESIGDSMVDKMVSAGLNI